MGILANIFAKIFPSSHPAATTTGPTTTPGGSTTVAAGTTTASPAMPQVDVHQVLTDMASKNPEKLNWETSIVDLMKLLGLDSSITHRKELATELHYTGDMNDSATMNTWLHKEVMRKLAESGGSTPPELMH